MKYIISLLLAFFPSFSAGPGCSPVDRVAPAKIPPLRKLPDLPLAKMFLDEQESYASNEFPIDWQTRLLRGIDDASYRFVCILCLADSPAAKAAHDSNGRMTPTDATAN